MLTLLMLEMEIPALGVNIMTTDALAPKVTRSSADLLAA